MAFRVSALKSPRTMKFPYFNKQKSRSLLKFNFLEKKIRAERAR